jgi:hypothetical protein
MVAYCTDKQCGLMQHHPPTSVNCQMEGCSGVAFEERIVINSESRYVPLSADIFFDPGLALADLLQRPQFVESP